MQNTLQQIMKKELEKVKKLMKIVALLVEFLSIKKKVGGNFEVAGVEKGVEKGVKFLYFDSYVH